jgi:Flp pilus assembly protein TadG
VREWLRGTVCRRPKAAHRALVKSERGSSLVELALIVPVLSLLLLAAVEFGRAYYLSIEVANAARAGAQFGVQNASLAGMQAAATSDAADIAGRDVSGFTSTASSGCECSDGSGQSSDCTSPPTCLHVVNYVQVTTTATYTPLIPLPGLPSSGVILHGQAMMRIGP